MAVWFSSNHGIGFSDFGTVFRDCFLAEFVKLGKNAIFFKNGKTVIFR